MCAAIYKIVYPSTHFNSNIPIAEFKLSLTDKPLLIRAWIFTFAVPIQMRINNLSEKTLPVRPFGTGPSP